jgi:UPF0716 protein FxsA
VGIRQAHPSTDLEALSVFVSVKFMVLAVLAAETLVTVLVAQQIGALWSFFWFVGSFLLGMLVIRMAGLKTALALRVARSGVSAVAGDTVLLFIAGVLLMIPGFLSDAVALLLLVPPIRRAVRLMIVRRAARRFPNVRSTFTAVRLADGSVVVPGEVVEDPTVRPEPGPGGVVLRGEVVDPPDDPR